MSALTIVFALLAALGSAYVLLALSVVVAPFVALAAAGVLAVWGAILTFRHRKRPTCKVAPMCTEILAKQAYDAYASESLREATMPGWAQLSRDEQRAWCAAARAVAKEVQSEDDFEL